MGPATLPRLLSGARARAPWVAPRRFVPLLIGLFLTAAGAVAGSPEGFSESVDGLPEDALGAWYGTLLIYGEAVVRRPHDDLRLRTNRGAGVVVGVDEEGGAAIVATNSHVVDCGEASCQLQAAFTAPADPDLPVWTDAVTVMGRAPNRDLSFLRVAIPEGVGVAVPRFASAGCVDVAGSPVYAIGWPDLSVRERWGVAPPANADQHVKRYSSGRFLLNVEGYRLVSRVRGRLDRMRVVFHNADVLPGSSGGPLVTGDGGVLGINTQVVGKGDSAHTEYCAREDLHDEAAECVHLAIASDEIAAEFERLFKEPLQIHGCSDASEGAAAPRRAARAVTGAGAIR